MALNRRRPNRTYGLDNALQEVAPRSIVSDRAPATNDIAEIGQQWIDKDDDTVYVLTSVTAGSANWSTSPASGATTLSSLTVTTTADIGTDATVGGTLDVTGDTTLVNLSVSGTFGISASTQLDFETSANQQDAIVLEATAGGIDILASGAAAGEDIDIVATGSSVNISSTESANDSIVLESTAGGIDILASGAAAGEDIDIVATGSSVNISSSEADAAALSLQAASGGLDVDTALQMNLTSSQNAADAIRINASAGGIDIDAAGAAAEDINIANAAGSIVLTAGESVADSILVESTAGGIDILASGAAAGEDIDIIATGSSVNINSTENAADSVVISSTNGGIDITASSAEDIDISGSGGVNISSTENAANAVFIEADGGTSETIQIHSDQGTAATSINLVSDVGGITLDATGLVGDAILLTAGAGSIVATAGEDAADAIYLHADAGTSEKIRLHADQGTATDSVELESDVGGVTLTAGLAGDAINFAATSGSIVATSGEDAADSIYLRANAGISETIRLHADQGTGEASVGLVSDVGGITLTAGLAGDAINFDATSGSITATSGEDAADSIYLHADAGTSEKIRLHADQGTATDSVELESDVGGVTLTAGLAGDAINFAATNGSIVATSGENAADSIYLHANAGTSEKIRLHADQGTATDSVELESDVGGVTLTAGLAGDAINFAATNGSIVGTSGENAADSIYLHANAGTSETIRLHADQGTGAASVHLESDVGGVTLTSGLASTDAINLSASAGGVDVDGALEVNITSSEAAVADAVTISASAADGGITLDAGVTPGVTVTNGTQSFQILTGSGSPNGSVSASQGSLYVDIAGSTSTTILFCNTDGGTTWVGVGA